MVAKVIETAFHDERLDGGRIGFEFEIVAGVRTPAAQRATARVQRICGEIDRAQPQTGRSGEFQTTPARRQRMRRIAGAIIHTRGIQSKAHL